MNLRIYAKRANWQRSLELLIFAAPEGNQRFESVAKPLVFEEATDESLSIAPNPTMKLTIEQGQQLMDELWNCGLRPSEGSGSAGAMAATQVHLQDLRKIVSKTLEVKLQD